MKKYFLKGRYLANKKLTYNHTSVPEKSRVWVWVSGFHPTILAQFKIFETKKY